MEIEITEIARKIEERSSVMGLQINEEQAEKLGLFSQLLLRWNSTYNLTAIRDMEEVLDLHILDSLSLVKAVGELFPDVSRVLDVGSGGGLPAIPLAIMRPNTQIRMCDAVKKKTIFLRQCIALLRLTNAKVFHARVEDLKQEPYELVTCRAFAEMSLTVSLTRHLLRDDGRWALMKAETGVDEIPRLPNDICVDKRISLAWPGSNLVRELFVLKRNRI